MLLTASTQQQQQAGAAAAGQQEGGGEPMAVDGGAGGWEGNCLRGLDLVILVFSVFARGGGAGCGLIVLCGCLLIESLW